MCGFFNKNWWIIHKDYSIIDQKQKNMVEIELFVIAKHRVKVRVQKLVVFQICCIQYILMLSFTVIYICDSLSLSFRVFFKGSQRLSFKFSHI